MKKEGMTREGFWIFLLIVFVVVVGSFVFFSSFADKFNSTQIDVEEVLIHQGVELEFKGNSIFKFDYEGNSYSLLFEDFSSSQVLMKKGTDEYRLEVLEEIELDLDRDSSSDLTIELREIGEKNKVYFKFIEKEVCQENWECTEWGPCIDRFESRVCIDQNQCNTRELKPEVRRSC